MVSSAIVRKLQQRDETDITTRTHAELDLTSQAAVNAFFEQEKPGQVYLAAAKVGGIYANNTYPAQFIYENLMIQANIIQSAHANGVQKLIFLGSSCIYPKGVPQPMREDARPTCTLEPLLSARFPRPGQDCPGAGKLPIRRLYRFAPRHGARQGLRAHAVDDPAVGYLGRLRDRHRRAIHRASVHPLVSRTPRHHAAL